MAKIQQFEEIQAWQKGRELCKLVYLATNKGAFSGFITYLEQHPNQ